MGVNLKWLDTARAGGNVSRCHTIRTIRHHTVAHHTHGAMTIAYELITAADAARVAVEPSAIIRHLLTHDVAEGYLGDTPAHVKAEYGRVSGALHAAEESWNTRNIPEYLTHQLVPYEKDLVKAADTLELGYFCVEEREMGNRAVAPVFNYVVDYVDRQELRKVHGVAPIIDCLTRRWRKFHAVDL